MRSRFQIVLATRNAHKIAEIKSILGPDIEYLTLGEFGKIKCREAGRTLLENSLIKAEFTFRVTGKPSLADDSGLFIDALDGAPGIFSSRYGKDDAQRIRRVLDELGDTKDRTARFMAVFVFYLAPGKYESFAGECAGRIAAEPKGAAGFGYDPIFIPRGYRRTFAELGAETKNRISHRATALKKFKGYLLKRSKQDLQTADN
jgi:XTP/dITP diphosphohydrolase